MENWSKTYSNNWSSLEYSLYVIAIRRVVLSAPQINKSCVLQNAVTFFVQNVIDVKYSQIQSLLRMVLNWKLYLVKNSCTTKSIWNRLLSIDSKKIFSYISFLTLWMRSRWRRKIRSHIIALHQCNLRGFHYDMHWLFANIIFLSFSLLIRHVLNPTKPTRIAMEY